MSSITLIAFLGNYGKKYEKTRHNVAWLFAEELAFSRNASWQSKFKGQFASVSIGEKQVYLLKPETYMNLSGESVIQCANFYKVPVDEILVIHDELDLPCGTSSLKWAGGLAGHNGLRSMKECFGTADFWRLRFGIGRPTHNDISNWVLSNFTSDETICLSQIFTITEPLIAELVSKDPQKLLQNWKKVSINS